MREDNFKIKITVENGTQKISKTINEAPNFLEHYQISLHNFFEYLFSDVKSFIVKIKRRSL